VASPAPGWTLDELAADFARCARWAVESGADCIETNFSCPNVDTSDGQLYQQPAAAARVASQVREAIGSTPLIIKIGFLDREDAIAELLAAVAPHANGLAMTNCISAKVEATDGQPLFDGAHRGIGGDAIREASIRQVARFNLWVKQMHYALHLIGVGGISTVEHVQDYVEAGAESVQLATSAMVDPAVGVRIRADLAAVSRCREMNRILTSN
jgi:dihydroorotate dehydrogenase